MPPLLPKQDALLRPLDPRPRRRRRRRLPLRPQRRPPRGAVAAAPKLFSRAVPLDSVLGAINLANVVLASNLAGLVARDTAAVTNLLTSVTQVTNNGQGVTQLTSFTSLFTAVTQQKSPSSKELQ